MKFMKPFPLAFLADALRRETVLRRETLLRDAVARRAGLRLRLVDLRLRLVDFLRRVVRLRFGAAFLRRVVRLRFGAAFLRRVVALRFGAAFLLRAGARRRDVDLRAVVFLLFVVVLLLAIFLPPLERTLALRLLVFLRLADLLLATRLLAGLRGFKITTSDNGMVLKRPEQRPRYKGVVGLYVGVIQNSHKSEYAPTYMGGTR